MPNLLEQSLCAMHQKCLWN